MSLYLSRANISIAALYMFNDCKEWQKWVLAGFYLGYTLTQVPCGVAASRFGGKAVLFTGVSRKCLPDASHSRGVQMPQLCETRGGDRGGDPRGRPLV